MANTSGSLIFYGQFESRVLGTFNIIRGFANLRDLAEVSVPYEMADGSNDVQVVGQQRKIENEHAERIKRYLETGHQRFLPEVILSVRVKVTDELDKMSRIIGIRTEIAENGISIRRRSKVSQNPMHQIQVDGAKLSQIRSERLIRRVDGNHRLALATELQDDPSLPSKYLAPFCMILLGPPAEAADDYSESLIFHTINSTALPLDSEHALRLILGQNPAFDMAPEKEFAFSPNLHLTRLLRDGVQRLPNPVKDRLGTRPLTGLYGAVRGLLESDASISTDLPTLNNYSTNLVAALSDAVTRLEPDQPSLCGAGFFVELAARVWQSTPREQSHAVRLNATVQRLEKIAAWLGKDGLLQLSEMGSLSKQIVDIFDSVFNRVPKRVFLARWYPIDTDGEEHTKASLRLEQIERALKELKEEKGIDLTLIDMGTQTGGTFPIHTEMYNAIASADIILIDLSGVRPNVCVEAGYALRHHEKNRLLFIFQPTPAHQVVPFDLMTYRYELFSDTGQIPSKIKKHIEEILQSAAVGG